MINTKTNEVACGPCIQSRGVLVTHEPPECNESVLSIRLTNVKTSALDADEILHRAFTEALRDRPEIAQRIANLFEDHRRFCVALIEIEQEARAMRG